ncbi:cupin domain-containing protein [Flavobacterium sp.]|uniref:cupin domain-containing protein n=1 Tax=Flavobacterium sp. TaxID=239 RepID=UPI003919B177
MLKKIIKKATLYLAAVLVAYLAIGYFFHLVIFPENKPDVATYFKPGQIFYSKTEKFKQTVVKQENGYVYCSLVIEPFADGPPKHIHTDFDEHFEVTNGELSVWVDGKIIKLQPGDSLFIPRGTPHQPFNETADTISVKGSIAFPEKFAFYLNQVYGVMDSKHHFEKSPETVFQMALFNSAGFDSYLADGPPVPIQKATGFLLTPIIRLMGYKSFYSEYDIRKNPKNNLNISKQ